MRVNVPLGGASFEYNSRKSRATIINGYIEANKQGNFTRIRRYPGLDPIAQVGDGPIRGMLSTDKFLYVVSGGKLYRLGSSLVVEELGAVGGVNPVTPINSIGTDDSQIMVLSDGNGYIYDEATTTFSQITDPNFTGQPVGNSIASLNQIFWVPQEQSNTFFGSATGDGTSWPATRIAQAEQNSDFLVKVFRTRSNLWLMGTKTCEYWQVDISDTDVPVRPVAGATIDRGIGADESVAQFQDQLFWLADDFTVWRIASNQAEKISDLDLEYEIRGDGTSSNSGYSTPSDAIGYFIDHPVHKLYVLNFIEEGKTWVYDVSTKVWQRRNSKDLDFWRARYSENVFDRIVVGDYAAGQIWEFTEKTQKEGDDVIPVQIISPSIRNDNASIHCDELELFAEVGQGMIGNVLNDVPKSDPIEPIVQLEVSKDGGATYKKKSSKGMGIVGDRQKKIIWRREIGRVKRGFNLVFRYTFSSDAPVIIYDSYLDII